MRLGDATMRPRPPSRVKPASFQAIDGPAALAIVALREERFDGPEVLRVRALDHIDGLDFD